MDVVQAFVFCRMIILKYLLNEPALVTGPHKKNVCSISGSTCNSMKNNLFELTTKHRVFNIPSFQDSESCIPITGIYSYIYSQII